MPRSVARAEALAVDDGLIEAHHVATATADTTAWLIFYFFFFTAWCSEFPRMIYIFASREQTDQQRKQHQSNIRFKVQLGEKQFPPLIKNISVGVKNKTYPTVFVHTQVKENIKAAQYIWISSQQS